MLIYYNCIIALILSNFTMGTGYAFNFSKVHNFAFNFSKVNNFITICLAKRYLKLSQFK